MNKVLLTSTLAAALALSLATSADAAQRYKVSADIQASCKAQAAKKFSAIHVMKRRSFVNECIAQHAKAKPTAATAQSAHAKSKTTTGQAPKAGTGNQMPKQSQ